MFLRYFRNDPATGIGHTARTSHPVARCIRHLYNGEVAVDISAMQTLATGGVDDCHVACDIIGEDRVSMEKSAVGRGLGDNPS